MSQELNGAIMGVVGGTLVWVFFMYFSAAVLAILFGTHAAPGFIRRGAYLYQRPRSGIEWSGLVLMALFALGSQATVAELARSYGASFGTIGRTALTLELVAAAGWLVFLVLRYARRR